jgi:hypothetical protein
MTGTRIGDKYKLEIGPDGKTRLIEDTKAIQAKKPVCARYTKNEAKPTSRRKADSVKKVDHG